MHQAVKQTNKTKLSGDLCFLWNMVDLTDGVVLVCTSLCWAFVYIWQWISRSYVLPESLLWSVSDMKVFLSLLHSLSSASLPSLSLKFTLETERKTKTKGDKVIKTRDTSDKIQEKKNNWGWFRIKSIVLYIHLDTKRSVWLSKPRSS